MYRLAIALLLLPVGNLVAEVRIDESGRGFHLMRNDKSYFIKGAGGSEYLNQLVEAGGNSIRTWGAENLQQRLDEAHKLGLTVTVGIWLGHERHGFNYQDDKAVVAQLKMATEVVTKFKNHPAVLMWGIGNEMEGDGNNPAVWYAVDHIARECKRIDPKHPTMTVIAELGERKVQNLHRFCPHIDVVGLNTYGGVQSIGQRYRKAGGTKPYVVTEYGPPGSWEVGKTKWDAPHEMTSTQKGKWYRDAYTKAVEAQRDLCLGSYAFVWGAKQEATATWFGMFLNDGSRTAAVEAMADAWGGKQRSNRCPQIAKLSLSKDQSLKPGDTLTATLAASDPDEDSLKVDWILRQDLGFYETGGDAQPASPEYRNAIVSSDASKATIRIPRSGGAYRLFAYVRDGQGNAAVANQPLHVDGPFVAPPAPKVTLPMIVYGDQQKGSPFTPSGFMGNVEAIKLTPDSKQTPHEGETCMKVEYRASDNWGGVVWQSPANDWGKRPGGFDLTGATELEFYARGEGGGEVISFLVGIIGDDMPWHDSTKVEIKNVELKKDWQKFRIPLDGRDLSRIKTGFGWSLAPNGAPVTFFLDEIRFVKK